MASDVVPTSATAASQGDVREANKNYILAFYKTAFDSKRTDLACGYLAPSYIEHDPRIEDGVTGFAKYHARLLVAYPQYSYEVRRIMSSGDRVIVHVLQRQNPWDRGDVQIHMYRMAFGKIAEHWVVANPIPETSLNANGLI